MINDEGPVMPQINNDSENIRDIQDMHDVQDTDSTEDNLIRLDVDGDDTGKFENLDGKEENNANGLIVSKTEAEIHQDLCEVKGRINHDEE